MQQAVMLNPTSIGRYIRKMRKDNDLSREALAELLTANGYECTDSAINHWESGRAKPPIEDPSFARALSLSLNVPPSELVKASGILDQLASPDLSSVLARFAPETVQLLKEAAPKDIKRIESMIRVMLLDGE